MRRSAIAAMLAVLLPALAEAQASAPVQCLLDLQIGRYCVVESLARTAIGSAVVVALILVWRFLRDRMGMREWQEEQARIESRFAALGDLSGRAASDPQGTAQLLRDRLGLGAVDHARQQRSLAFKAGDIETAAAWEKVERALANRFTA